MNTNISSLQTIVSAIQKNDQISGIAPISKNGEEIGYSISFTSGKTIIIYHGTDGAAGADGQNGKDGVDGHTPMIGVKQDTDGVYYWTIDGEWLLDDKGNKIKAVGTDGKDGENGENGLDGTDGKDGADGKNGVDGTDGITPQLKIDNGYWYISYDNGTTWKQLGKATGEDGANGVDGKDGDSFFQSVTQDDKCVYFTLADGTIVTIPLASKMQNIELTYIPRYSDGKATVFYTTAKSDSYVEFDFDVSPISATADWSDIATIKVVYTETRASADVVSLDILEWATDVENGIIRIKASGANLSDAFFNGSNEASARLVIQSDAVNIVSSYIPMIAKRIINQPNNEIWYTTTDGNTINPQNAPAIISNEYKNGKGIISFYEDLTEIGYQEFYYCSNLATISLPNSIVTIHYAAFEGCKNLTHITMSNNVTEIGSYAFHSCTSLTEVTIPNKVAGFGYLAFGGCSSLASFYGKYASFDSRCIVIDKVLVFFAPFGLYSYTIPENVATIGKAAFYSCGNLVDITIPSNVKQIETNAFSGCTGLQEVYCQSATPPVAGTIFPNSNSSMRIYVPSGSGAKYKAADGWKVYADIIVEKDM